MSDQDYKELFFYECNYDMSIVRNLAIALFVIAMLMAIYALMTLLQLTFRSVCKSGKRQRVLLCNL